MTVKFFFKNQPGFTLLEAIVVVGIFALFSSMMLINFRGEQKQEELNRAALLMVDGIRRVQAMAFAGAPVNNQTPLNYSFVIEDCLVDCYYQLIATLEEGGDIGSQLVIETVNFQKKIFTPNDSKIEIKFSPPRAQAKFIINQSEDFSEEVDLILSHSDLNRNKIITVNRISGRIDIKNKTAD